MRGREEAPNYRVKVRIVSDYLVRVNAEDPPSAQMKAMEQLGPGSVQPFEVVTTFEVYEEGAGRE